MSCINCHNPHVSVKFTPRSQYINACLNCHGGGQGKSLCTEKEQVRAAKNNDCITCHMPHNGSIDIPHVAVTDHFIRRKPANDTLKKNITAFLGMKCYNNDKPDNITIARSFLEFYERYTPSKGLLDSAIVYLDKQKDAEVNKKQNRDYIRVYSLLKDYKKVTDFAAPLKPEAITDAWASYRIADAYYQLQQAEKGLPWYKRAIEIWPYSLDFQNKYGTCLLSMNQLDKALSVFQFVIKENPNHISANTNLGFLYLQQGNSPMAYDFLLKAQQLDPDYEQNLINLAVWYHANNRNADAERSLLHLLQKYPGNEQAKAMLADLIKS